MVKEGNHPVALSTALAARAADVKEGNHPVALSTALALRPRANPLAVPALALRPRAILCRYRQWLFALVRILCRYRNHPVSLEGREGEALRESIGALIRQKRALGIQIEFLLEPTECPGPVWGVQRNTSDARSKQYAGGVQGGEAGIVETLRESIGALIRQKRALGIQIEFLLEPPGNPGPVWGATVSGEHQLDSSKLAEVEEGFGQPARQRSGSSPRVHRGSH